MPGDIYISETLGRHRRVLAVLQDRCFYSIGSDRNRDCLVTTMWRWIKHNKARKES